LRKVTFVVAALAALLAGFALYVRAAPSDPAVWHVDPRTAPGTGKPNAWRIGPPGSTGIDAEAPVYRLAPEALAKRLDAIAIAEPRARRLAGSPEAGFVTYVHRSRVFGFPDYTSVRVEPAEGGTTLAIFARARFGTSDLGVNRARVERWLATLANEAAG
jgi:uncharacterized protein (DUF1499 family)